MQLTLKILMASSLLIMFFALFVPAFFTKSRKTNTVDRNVIVISTTNKDKQARYLAYAENLVKDRNVMNEEIILIATDSGINLYSLNSPQRERLEALMQKGVQLFVCDKSYQATPTHFDLIPHIRHVANGAAFADELMNSGYINEFA